MMLSPRRFLALVGPQSLLKLFNLQLITAFASAHGAPSFPMLPSIRFTLKCKWGAYLFLLEVGQGQSFYLTSEKGDNLNSLACHPLNTSRHAPERSWREMKLSASWQRAGSRRLIKKPENMQLSKFEIIALVTFSIK